MLRDVAPVVVEAVPVELQVEYVPTAMLSTFAGSATVAAEVLLVYVKLVALFAL